MPLALTSSRCSANRSSRVKVARFTPPIVAFVQLIWGITQSSHLQLQKQTNILQVKWKTCIPEALGTVLGGKGLGRADAFVRACWNRCRVSG